MKDQQKGLMKYLLRGVLFALPIAVTLFLLKFAIGLSNDWFGVPSRALLRLVLSEELLNGYLAFLPGFFSLVLLLAVLLLLGRIASWQCGRQGLRLIDVVFQAIPGVRSIYSAVRKMVEALGGENKSSFKRAVLIPWGSGGTKTMGFVTKEVVDRVTGVKHLVVFVPTPPNPASGFITIVPESEAVDPGFGMDQALKIAMSLGVLTPDEINATCPRSAGGDTKGDGTGSKS